jgi:hypothetical protein
MGRIGTLIALETPTKSHKSRFAKVCWYLVLELRKCLIKTGVDVPGLRKEMKKERLGKMMGQTRREQKLR